MEWHAQRFAPILERETEKTRNMEWLRYGTKLEQITTSITGFKLSDEEADELKAKMSEETSQQLSRDSVCQVHALDVRTDEWCNVTVIEKSEDKLILDWTNCTGCEVGKTVDFDFKNSFWKDNYYTGSDVVFYATSQSLEP